MAEEERKRGISSQGSVGIQNGKTQVITPSNGSFDSDSSQMVDNDMRNGNVASPQNLVQNDGGDDAAQSRRRYL